MIDSLEDDDPENLILVDNSTNSIIYTHKNEKSSFYRRLLFSDYQWSNDSKWVIFTHDNIEDVLPVDIYLFDVESKNLSTISSDITTQNAYLLGWAENYESFYFKVYEWTQEVYVFHEYILSSNLIQELTTTPTYIVDSASEESLYINSTTVYGRHSPDDLLFISSMQMDN